MSSLLWPSTVGPQAFWGSGKLSSADTTLPYTHYVYTVLHTSIDLSTLAQVSVYTSVVLTMHDKSPMAQKLHESPESLPGLTIIYGFANLNPHPTCLRVGRMCLLLLILPGRGSTPNRHGWQMTASSVLMAGIAVGLEKCRSCSTSDVNTTWDMASTAMATSISFALEQHTSLQYFRKDTSYEAS